MLKTLLLRDTGYFLGYCWSGITTGVGLVCYLLARALRWVEKDFSSGPAHFVFLRGPLAERMQKPDAGGHVWEATTIGPFVFIYDPEPQQWLFVHEERHVWQQIVLGPFAILIYAGSFLWGLIRYLSFRRAYHECVLERDARRVAGEED